MRRRGFTLAEIGITMSVLALLLPTLLAWFVMMYRQEHCVFSQASAQMEAAHAVAAVQHHLAVRAGYRLDADNAGMRLADGTTLRLQDRQVRLGGASLFSVPVEDLCLVQEGRYLSMTITLDVPAAAFDQHPRPLRMVYDVEAP